MYAGQFRQSVKIQQNSKTLDDYGEALPAQWTDHATVWADVKMLSGLQTIKDGVDVSMARVSIRIRYRTDITAGMRVSHGGEVYDIRAVLPDVAHRRYTDLVCEVGQNDG